MSLEKMLGYLLDQSAEQERTSLEKDLSLVVRKAREVFLNLARVQLSAEAKKRQEDDSHAGIWRGKNSYDVYDEDVNRRYRQLVQEYMFAPKTQTKDGYAYADLKEYFK